MKHQFRKEEKSLGRSSQQNREESFLDCKNHG
jgi:hypothetical protein